jgi:hypothetical protein
MPDRNWQLDNIMLINIVLDLYYCKVLWFKLNGYHLVISSHEDIAMP